MSSLGVIDTNVSRWDTRCQGITPTRLTGVLPSLPDFDDLHCHDTFEAHQANAGRRVVSCDEAIAAWYGRRLIIRNRKGGIAPYLFLGRTLSGRRITVVILPTDDPQSWLAYTAWDT